MKKNKFLRLASALVIMTLLSTCAISGTFAKYTTNNSASDSARVAKFGVTLTITDESNFKTAYKSTGDTITVESFDTDKITAPGTSGNAITFAISGTPEVATKIDVIMTVTSDIYVKAGEHLDYTTAGDTSDKFTLNDDYYPVVFTLKQTKNADGTMDTVIATGNLAAIKAELDKYTETARYAPNTNLTAEFQLSWEWKFDGNDKADTLLGNVAVEETSNENVCTELEYSIKFSVTQVD